MVTTILLLDEQVIFDEEYRFSLLQTLPFFQKNG